MKKLIPMLVAGLFAVTSSAWADFKAGMTVMQLQAEVKAQITSGKSAASIAKSGLDANVNLGDLTKAMIDSGVAPGVAISALIGAGAEPNAVQMAAERAGVPANDAASFVRAARLSSQSLTGRGSGSAGAGGTGSGGGGKASGS